MSTDKDWEKWGSRSPYFGVLSRGKYRDENLSDSARRDFFGSGAKHVERVLCQYADENQRKPATVLDYGCGVGRLLIPFASQAHRVTGADVSPSMLEQARRNLEEFQTSNCDLICVRETLSELGGPFELVHSVLVLQHIHPRQGMEIIKVLGQCVADNGMIHIQFFVGCNAPKWKRTLVLSRYRIPPLNWIRNLVKGRPVFEPAMQLHVYSESEVEKTLASVGVTRFKSMQSSSPDREFESLTWIGKRVK